MQNNLNLQKDGSLNENWKEKHDFMAGNKEYLANMHPDLGPRWIVEKLRETLQPGSSVFEYGVGSGANAIYLSKNGFSVEAQDISGKMIEILKANLEKEGVKISIEECGAEDYTPPYNYNAFVCTNLLHFMPGGSAIKVIENMQKNTSSGGYNALELCTNESSHAKPFNERFYPDSEVLEGLYDGWIICEKIIVSSRNTDNNLTVHVKILFQKPDNSNRSPGIIKRTKESNLDILKSS